MSEPMITAIADHADQALARLLSQFAEKPNMEALVGLLGDRAQGLEDVLFALIEGRSVNDATGATLEKIGAMVGEPRPATGLAATDDEAYRALVLGRIVANSSHGTAEDVGGLLTILGATHVRLRDLGDATLMIQYQGELITEDAQTLELLEQATAPVLIQDVTEYGAIPFGFAGTPGAAGFGEGAMARSVS